MFKARTKGCTELIVVSKALTGHKRSFMHFIPMKTKWEEDEVRDDDDTCCDMPA